MQRTKRRENLMVRRLAAAAAAALFTICGGAFVAQTMAPVLAAPEPDPVPRRWQLDLVPGHLRTTTLDVPGVGPRAYFYMTYKVTNNTTEDLLFAPNFEMSNAEGELLRSGRDVPAEVTRRIMESLGNPLLQDQIGILGVLLQGDANAKEGLVVWPATDMDTNEVTVYAAGFSGETRPIDIKDAETGNWKRVMLRKTLMIRYRIPGELRGQGSRPLDAMERRWILR